MTENHTPSQVVASSAGARAVRARCSTRKPHRSGAFVRGAAERTRTADPFITSEVLYQLSYGGAWRSLAPGGATWRGAQSSSPSSTYATYDAADLVALAQHPDLLARRLVGSSASTCSTNDSRISRGWRSIQICWRSSSSGAAEDLLGERAAQRARLAEHPALLGRSGAIGGGGPRDARRAR